MLKSKKSILNKFMIAKDELVSMRLHFRYHVYLYAKTTLLMSAANTAKSD